ncbi:MAG: exodeoxyribonuclease VII large subunit [Bacteroidota bacterium]
MHDAEQTYSVGELTFYVKHRLENDTVLRDVRVSGEVSNITRHGSGHVYFTLKDAQAQLSCAMFRNVADRYRSRLPDHGEKITVRGQISVYPPRGSYQLIVRAFERAGVGDLHREFLLLKDKLEKEGLFSADHKQAIPAFPRTVGVVTSPTGAVIQDITNTIRRRYPHVKLLLAPAKVQGDGAAATIVRSLEALNDHGEVDVILLGRGGGSLEDLWCFNEESVARAIFASKIPIISGVGHQTDVTISDFVADYRAETPTAAAEKAVPVAEEIRAWLDDADAQLRRNLQHYVDIRRQLLDDYATRFETRMKHQIAIKRQQLADFSRRLESAALQAVDRQRHALDVLETRLHNLDIREVMKRGYAVVEKDGVRIKDSTQLEPDDEIVTHFYLGAATAQVKDVHPPEPEAPSNSPNPENDA